MPEHDHSSSTLSPHDDMSSDITQVSDISSDSDTNAIQPLFAKAPPPAKTSENDRKYKQSKSKESTSRLSYGTRPERAVQQRLALFKAWRLSNVLEEENEETDWKCHVCTGS